MYFLRWIAGYPILIILLVTALYAVYNKDSLKHWFDKDDVAEEVSHQAAEVKEGVSHAADHAAPDPAATEPYSQVKKDSSVTVTAEADTVERSGSWLDRFTHRNPAPEAKVEHTAPVLEIVEAEPVVVAEERSGSWLDRFTHRNPVATVDHTTTEAAAVVTETVENAEEKSASWLDAFKREKTEMEAPAEVVAENGKEAAAEKQDKGSWLDIFKNKNAKADHEVVAETSAAAGTAAVTETEPSEPPENIPAEKDSGSWLDTFKRENKESEADTAGVESVVTETAAAEQAASSEAAVAAEEKESGSWLDIFKSKSSTAETPPEEDQSDASSTVAANHGQQRSESLRLAREAFWNRDYDAAAAIYENMSQAEPNNLDLLGEYGNFLLQTGKMDQALDIYETIAIALVRENRQMEVHPLLEFIGNQDPDRAHALSRKLNDSQ